MNKDPISEVVGRFVRFRGNAVSAEARSRVLVATMCLTLSVAATGALAQPDPSQMSGIPRPDQNLPDGVVTVRVIRGSFANNVTGQLVELLVGDRGLTEETDVEGRATFTVMSPGERATVATTLDGQLLESQPFEMPGRGGVAVMLVGARVDGGDPVSDLSATPGRVSLGPDSRILIELGEENIEVYYVLEVLNVADGPVNPQPAFELSLPAGAQSGTVLQGSSPRTIVDGSQVSVSGAIGPGITPVQVAYVLPYAGGNLALSQIFPADFDELLVFVEKWGAMDVASTLFERRGEMAAEETAGAPLVWGAGRRIGAGEPVLLELSGLPYHSGWPRIITLTLAALIVALSVWGSAGVEGRDGDAERRALLGRRREKLFTELVKVERQRRQGKIQATRYGTRRAELIGQLQRVLHDLEDGLAPVDTTVSAAPVEAPA